MKAPLDTTILPTNRLLASLRQDEYARLFPNAELIRLPRNRILYETGDEVHHAYFLINGMASLLAITEDGQTVDICTVGNEGVIGLPIVFGVAIMPCRVVTQLPSEALMLTGEQLLLEFSRGETLHEVLLKYSYVQQTQVIQSAICHALHTIRQRLSGWLLVVGDSVQSESFNMTQEHVANMLGHQRNRVTLAARKLLQQGLVTYAGGSVTILDRLGLEAAACECYQVNKQNAIASRSLKLNMR